jgi:hypothetical protein
MSTVTAYEIRPGQVVILPGIRRPKKVYRCEDAGVRYQINELGQTEHIPQIRFHVNAPPKAGIPGTVLLDFDAEVPLP